MDYQFDWVPFYTAFADKLRTFRSNRKALIEIICKVFETLDVPLPTLENENGHAIVPVDVDPFTVFGLFNKQIKHERRIAICRAFIELLSMDVAAPSCFHGLPVLNNQKATFYYFLGDRQEDDIDQLWAFFEAALDYAAEQNEVTRGKFVTSYNQVLSQKGIKWNITMGLFWIRPAFYLSLDGRNRWLLQNGESDEIAAFLEEKTRQAFLSDFVEYVHSFKEPPNAEDYLAFLATAKAKMAEAGYHGTVDFSYCAYTISEVVNQQIKKDALDEIQEEEDESCAQAWIIAPGADACFLDEFVSQQAIKLGWGEVGDLLRYADKTALYNALQSKDEDYSEKSPKIAAGMLWSFCHGMREGDIIFLKKGMTQIVGRGVVKSAYRYEDQGHYKHVRGVEWTHVGQTWDAPFKLPFKTLSKVSLEKCNLLEKMLENDGILEDSDTNNASLSIAEKESRNYWWLNANPKIWSMASTPVGTEQDYTLYNDKQHKRRVFQYFLDAQVGDILVGYESTPVKQIVALFEISKAQDGERICFKKIEHLTSPIDLTALQAQSELAEMEFFKNSQASLLKLTTAEYECILDLIREANPIVVSPKKDTYTKADFLGEVFMDGDRYDALAQMLRLKKNVILQGAPGVGKTFAAKRLAYAMMGVKDEGRIEMVQFHQNYSYEDFVMGYKPEGATFALKHGVFYRFCQKAASDPKQDYFFIIDEINRGNMSKIFGELLMLIEKDYRGTSMKLAYSDVPFNVPQNLHLVGMMNTADRSLAMIDYALRRRFSFFDIAPGFDSDGFKQYQQALESVRFDDVVAVLKQLNLEIADDKSLGKGFCIGHSYLCNLEKNGLDDHLKNVVAFDILPMLAEYWFDEMDKYERWATALMDVFK